MGRWTGYSEGIQAVHALEPGLPARPYTVDKTAFREPRFSTGPIGAKPRKVQTNQACSACSLSDGVSRINGGFLRSHFSAARARYICWFPPRLPYVRL